MDAKYSPETPEIRLNNALKHCSRSLRKVLVDAHIDMGDGVTAFGPLSFLIAAARSRDRSSAARIFDQHSRKMLTVNRLRNSLLNNSDDEKNLLIDCIDTAYELREYIGGKDSYIGLRHLLFVVLVPPDRNELLPLFKTVGANGVDPGELAESISQFCLDYSEVEEDEAKWREIIQDRLEEISTKNIPVTRGRQVAHARSDNPWLQDVVDRSGASGEAEAFASMICSKAFTPPLAVGIFGNWGSGKSFFMRLVYDAIYARCAKTTKSEIAAQTNNSAQAASGPDFHKHVVQIRFNAWHYAETNLWASLVDHIFTELDGWAQTHNRQTETDRVFERLATAREWTIEAAETLIKRRKEKQAATAERAEAKAKLQEKKDALILETGNWANAAWISFLADTKAKKELAEAANDLGVATGTEGEDKDLQQAVELYIADHKSPAARDWLRLISARPKAGAALIAAIIFAPMILALLLDWFGVESGEAALSGIFAPMALYAGWAAQVLRKGHEQLTSAHNKVQQIVEEKSQVQAAALKAAEAAVEDAQAQESAAVDRLRHVTERLGEIEDAFNQQNGKRRILSLVRERVSEGEYRKQLGFIAKARRDFDELSQLMNADHSDQPAKQQLEEHRLRVEALITKAGENLTGAEIDQLLATTRDASANEPAVFERIILYIDDLDRCPPEQVLVVLQAIHLLLAFPLFVVFVAVDVRWLRAALLKQYEHFAKKGEVNAIYGDQASPGDYLEKIFQIPYWVRPMSKDNMEGLLEDYMGPSLAEPNRPDLPTPPDPDPNNIQPGDIQPSDLPVSPGQKDKLITPEPTEPVAEDTQFIKLSLSEREREFIIKLAAGLDGSPRRALRFVNSYHLIKAGHSGPEQAKIEQQSYWALLALLAIQIGVSEDIDGVLDGLEAQPSGPLNIEKFTAGGGAAISKDAATRLKAILEAIEAEEGDPTGLRRHADTIKRFSFGMA